MQGARGGMMRRLFFGFGVVIAFSAPALAELAMTGAPVAMRAAPSGKAAVVQRVPASAEIEVDKNCPRGWGRASWRHLSGYIPAEAVVLPGRRRHCRATKCRRRSSMRSRPGPRRRYGDGRAPMSGPTSASATVAGRPGLAIGAAPTHERRADLYGGLTP